jgi:hypothetical protein
MFFRELQVCTFSGLEIRRYVMLKYDEYLHQPDCLPCSLVRPSIYEYRSNSKYYSLDATYDSKAKKPEFPTNRQMNFRSRVTT